MASPKFSQAAHVLKLIDEQNPTDDVVQKLFDGYLTDLVRAGVERTLPPRHKFQEALGLIPIFKVWKTIKIGTGPKNADDFRMALKKAGMKIGDCGNDILGKPAFTVSKTETEVDLVVVTVGELGFKRGAARRDIIAKALEVGLQLCPAEVGPQLSLQYADQPKGEWLVIGMEPITVSDGYPYVFSVAHDGGSLWLSGNFGDPDDVWDADTRFVFVRPRK